MNQCSLLYTLNALYKSPYTDACNGSIIFLNNMTNTQHSPLITILGPTASGKTKLAVNLAKHFNGEIISSDSRQVYRQMDIGTGKDLDEYGDIPYHLIDIIDPHQEYNLFDFSKDFCSSFSEIKKNNRLPFLVGGTGMYLDAVLSRYKLTIANNSQKSRQTLEKKSDSELVNLLLSFNQSLHNTTDLKDRNRLINAISIARADKNNEPSICWPDYTPFIIGIRVSQEMRRSRITERLKIRLNEGMIEEVQNLRDQGISAEKLHYFGLEYRYIGEYLAGGLNYNDMFQKLNSAIHHFSKQQEKWFRKIESKNQTIQWIDSQDDLNQIAIEKITQFLNLYP